MNKGNINEILARLRRELEGVKDLDPDAQRESAKLHRYAAELEDPENTDLDLMLDRAKELEARFAATHPNLERLARELADAIAKMGV